jgi:arylsulfatase
VNRAPWQAFGPANPDPLNDPVFLLDASVAPRIVAPRPMVVLQAVEKGRE